METTAEESIENAVEETGVKAQQEVNPSSLPRVLRYIGATTLGLSALSFAVKRVHDLDSIGRYHSFLGFTVVLAACGLLCGLKLKEDKGARTFLGISLVFLPALYLQLGGLVYFMKYGIATQMPAMFRLIAPDDASVITCLAISIPVALAISFAGFSALVRSHAKSLTAFFALGLGALLIPTRTVDIVAFMILGFGVAMAFISSVAGRRDAAMRTFEGRMARLISAIPLLLMISRTVFYGPTELFVAALFAVIGTFLWSFSENTPGGRASSGQILGLTFYSFAWACFCQALMMDPNGCLYLPLLANLRAELLLPLITLPIAGGLIIVAPRLGSDNDETIRWAGRVAGYSMAYQAAAVENIGITAMALFLGAGIVSAGYLRKDRSLLASGGILVATVLAINVHYALDLYRMNPWLTLGVTGGAILLASSYVERNLARIIGRVERARQELGSW